MPGHSTRQGPPGVPDVVPRCQGFPRVRRCGVWYAAAPHADRAMPDLDPTPEEREEIARSARWKVACRTLPLLFLLYVVAYLDRTNVSAAKLKMKDDLAFSEAVFG